MHCEPLQHTPAPPQTVGIDRALAFVKLARLMAALVRAGWILSMRFPRMGRDDRLAQRQRWAQSVLAILDVDVRCTGSTTAPSAALVVANHLSWLDILVIQSVTPGVFVAKAEVRRWPLIGAVAQACATIFVQRSSTRSARAMVQRCVATFAQGYSVVGFPEGTSTNGSHVGPFHSNLFEAAVQAGVQVQPLTLRYLDAQTRLPSDAPVFIGDTTLVRSLRKVLAAPSISAHVHVGTIIPTLGHTRRSLAALAHQSVRESLRHMAA